MLHMAPFAVMAFFVGPQELASVGEEVIDLDMIIADPTTASAPPSENETDPDAATASAHAMQQAVRKPEDQPPPEPEAEEKQAETKPDLKVQTAEETAVSLASAAPPAAASEATRAALNTTYHARVARHLVRFKRFPPGVSHARSTGRVVVSFRLTPEGRVTSVHLVEGSGVMAFDAEAMEMIRRADPFPRPLSAHRDDLSFTIPVAYRLRE
jgi:protein TonB